MAVRAPVYRPPGTAGRRTGASLSPAWKGSKSGAAARVRGGAAGACAAWGGVCGCSARSAARLRRRGLIDHFLAFSLQNVGSIGNLDQSLLNYFFGRRITRLEGRWNRPPYQADCLDTAHIVHFHGPKPWDVKSAWARELRINHFEALRRVWLDYLEPDERALAESWG